MDIYVIFIIGAFVIGLGLGLGVLIYERHKKGKEELNERIKARLREEYMNNPDNFREVDRTPDTIKCLEYGIPYLQLDELNWTPYAKRLADLHDKNWAKNLQEQVDLKDKDRNWWVTDYLSQTKPPKVWNPEYIVIPPLMSREDILKWINTLHRYDVAPTVNTKEATMAETFKNCKETLKGEA